MAETHVTDLLATLGIRNEDYIHDQREAFHLQLFEEVGRQEQLGKIPAALASDYRRALIDDALENMSMTEYNRHRDAGTLDQLLALPNRYQDDSDISQEAHLQRRQDALNAVLMNMADERYAAGLLNGNEYAEVVSRADPNAYSDGRRRAGVAQLREGNLDGEMRDLEPAEAATAATAAFFSRNQMTTGPAPSEPERENSTPRETISNAALHAAETEDMEAYVRAREADSPVSDGGQSDGVYQTRVD